ncbi:MAG: glycoside hydrolase family 2 protein [Acidimicrobiales bacterium]
MDSVRPVELSGTWLAHLADDHLRRDVPDAGLDESDWHEVSVPDHWRNWPAFADNDAPIFLRHHFDLDDVEDGQRTFLRFDGVAYQGDVWLDGDYLGATEGYFFPHAFEITDLAEARSDHVLTVEVSCPPVGDPSARRTLMGALQHSPFVSRSWNPGGIWRPVHIDRTGPVRIRFFRMICSETTTDERRGTLALRAVVHTDESTDVVFRTTVAGLVDEHPVPLAAGENRVEWSVPVDDIDLWWPHSLGEQPLYDAEVTVMLGDGSVSDQRRRRVGFRSIQFRNWISSINGERLFLKGACLGPTVDALGTADHDQVVGDVRAAREAGLDLLRIHSHVARPELYDTADELGILLWQDMPMSGQFARSVGDQATRQAREMVDLLGHHASVMLWCAHDEPDPMPTAHEYRPTAGIFRRQRPTWNRTVLDRRVKQVLTKFDESRPVIAHAGVLPHLPQLDGSSSHLWFGWQTARAAEAAGFLARMPRLARFISAFGAQAVPDTTDFIDHHAWPDLDWGALEHEHGLEVEAACRHCPPEDFETFADWQAATQRHQAAVVKTSIEILRRLKYRPTGGFALFHLADAHPAVSHAVLDHQRRAKPAFRTLVDACRPVIVVADPMPAHATPGDPITLDIHAINDLRQTIPAARIKAVVDVDGDQRTWVWEGELPADEVVRVGQVEWPTPSTDAEVVLDLELTSELATATNRYNAVVRSTPAVGEIPR